MSVVEHVKEGEAGVFVDRRLGGWVDEVPGGANIGVWDVETVIEIGEGVDY